MAYTLPEAIWLVRAGVTDDVLVGYPSGGSGRARRTGRGRRAGRGGHPDGRQPRPARPDRRGRRRRTGAHRFGSASTSTRRGGRRAAPAHRRAALAGALAPAARRARRTCRRPAWVPAGRPDVVRGTDRRARRRAARSGRCRPPGPGHAAAARTPSCSAGAVRRWRRSASTPTWSSSTAAAPAAWPRPRPTRRSPRSPPAPGCTGRRCSTPTAPGARPGRVLRPLAWCAGPAPGLVTVLGGGWIASGPAGPSRLPSRGCRPGCACVATEGAGEVQTPLAGAGGRHAARRRPGVVPPRQGRRAVRARQRAAPVVRAEDWSNEVGARPTAARPTPSVSSASHVAACRAQEASCRCRYLADQRPWPRRAPARRRPGRAGTPA